MARVILLSAAFWTAGLFPGAALFARDFYAGVAALRANEVEGRDYRVEVVDRGARVTVFAIHGGTIEPGTSEAARALARAQGWNLYLFEGLAQGDAAQRLHVTSTHFDDPAALELAGRSLLGVSIHGEGGGADICVGGLNGSLRRKAGKALAASGFAVEEPCGRSPGLNPANIVNRARGAGIQLEISPRLRGELSQDEAVLGRLLAAIRGAVSSYLSGPAGQDPLK